MKKYSIVPDGVCAREISFEIDDENKVRNITFSGGCSGNGKGVSALAEGLTPDELIVRLTGIECGRRMTSCPDQLAKAVKKAIENE